LSRESKFETQILEDWKLKDLKKKRIFEIKLGKMMKEFIIYLLFLFFLYFVSFSNISPSAIVYNKLFFKTFAQRKNQNEIGLNQVFV